MKIKRISALQITLDMGALKFRYLIKMLLSLYEDQAEY